MLIPEEDVSEHAYDEWTEAELLLKYTNPITRESRVRIRYKNGIEDDVESGSVDMAPLPNSTPANTSHAEGHEQDSTSAMENVAIPCRGHPLSSDGTSDSDLGGESSSKDDPRTDSESAPDSEATLSDSEAAVPPWTPAQPQLQSATTLPGDASEMNPAMSLSASVRRGQTSTRGRGRGGRGGRRGTAASYRGDVHEVRGGLCTACGVGVRSP